MNLFILTIAIIMLGRGWAEKFVMLNEFCPSHEEKTTLNLATNYQVLQLNSSNIRNERPFFKCHIEVTVPSTDYGFSVFIEEMNMSGKIGECRDSWVQFGRDILFLTTFKTAKYCGKHQNISTFHDNELTSLDKRFYIEEEDSEMDIWIQMLLTEDLSGFRLLITPFKKNCNSKNFIYQQCGISTVCIKKQWFCDGNFNCPFLGEKASGE